MHIAPRCALLRVVTCSAPACRLCWLGALPVAAYPALCTARRTACWRMSGVSAEEAGCARRYGPRRAAGRAELCCPGACRRLRCSPAAQNGLRAARRAACGRFKVTYVRHARCTRRCGPWRAAGRAELRRPGACRAACRPAAAQPVRRAAPRAESGRRTRVYVAHARRARRSAPGRAAMRAHLCRPEACRAACLPAAAQPALFAAPCGVCGRLAVVFIKHARRARRCVTRCSAGRAQLCLPTGAPLCSGASRALRCAACRRRTADHDFRCGRALRVALLSAARGCTRQEPW